jgi:predicted RNA-binding protein YlqC (UPF0109 family)
VKQLVETVCKSLVDNPDEVKVTQIDGEQTTILELRVHQTDLGKVIGKQGRTARAIRTILAAAGMKQRRRFNLEIIERFDERESDEERE